ncbi:MAG: hypothetical protein U0531_18420 [Dehalococcoidia bacterium]
MILFLNNTVVTPGFLAALVARAGGRTLVVPRVELAGTDGLMDDTVGDFDWRRGVAPTGRPPPPAGAPGGARRADGEPVLPAGAGVRLSPRRPLDERLFMYYEDFDFLRRARARPATASATCRRR